MAKLFPQDRGVIAYFGTFQINISTAVLAEDQQLQHLSLAAAGMFMRSSEGLSAASLALNQQLAGST